VKEKILEQKRTGVKGTLRREDSINETLMGQSISELMKRASEDGTRERRVCDLYADGKWETHEKRLQGKTDSTEI